MHKIDILKSFHSREISQMIHSPILVFDYWELTDVFAALAVVFIFGVLFYSWGSMLVLLVLVLGIGPAIKRKYPRGIFMHWPHANLYMRLPGLINPQGSRKFSD